MRFLLFSIALFFSFCKNQPQKTAETIVELPADFVDFYKKFHADTAFQMAHIQFPLPEREPSKNADGSLKLSLVWTPETWAFQSLPNLSTGEFRRDFEPISQELIVEKIETTGDIAYAIVRRWAKLSGDWALIYYSAGLQRRPETNGPEGLSK